MSCTFRSSLSSNHDVVNVFYEMVKENLGTAGSVRCIVSGDTEDEVYVKDTVEILKHLDVQHPVGGHVVKVCQGHKDVYGCGVKSMLFLMGQLCQRVRQLMEQGVPLFYIEELLNEAIEECIHNLHVVTIPITLSSPTHHQSASAQSASPASTTFPPATHNDATQQVHPAADPATLHSGSVDGDSACFKMDDFEPNSCGSAQNIQKRASGQRHDDGLGSPPVFDQGEILVRGRGGDLKPRKFCNLQAWQHVPFKADSSKLVPADSPQAHQFLALLKDGQVSAGTLNGFLSQLRKPAASTNFHRGVVLSSRHLQNCSAVEQDWLSSPSEPQDTCNEAVKQISQSDHVPFVQPQERLSSADQICHSVNIPAELKESSADGSRSVFLPEEAQVLSHECGDMMEWAREAMHHQLLHGKFSRLDINLIHTRCISGRHGLHHLLHGLVIQADTDVMDTVSRMSSPVSLLLIKGDLTAEFRHKGYKASMSATRIIQGQEFLHQQQRSWHAQVLSLLKKLKVRAVLVQGVVDTDLKDQSLAAGIAVVQRVPFPALHVLQAACHVDFVTYILDAHEGNICAGVCLRPLLEDWCDSLGSEHKHLIITTSVFIQTLVISEPSAAGRQMLEEEFWRSTARLAQAVEDGRVLPGGGATECWCAHQLTHTEIDRPCLNLKWPGELALYRPVVRAALADAFLAYASAVKHNRQRAGHKVNSQHAPIGCNDKPVPPSDPSPHCQREQLSLHAPSVCNNAPLLLCSPCPNRFEKLSSHTLSTSPDYGSMQGLLAQEQQLQKHEPCLCGSGGSDCARWQLHNSPRVASSGCGGELAVCDNYSSKVSGWRSAINCVCSVMRMDRAITTGLDQQTKPAHSVLL